MADIGLPPPPKQHKGFFGKQQPQQDMGGMKEDMSNISRRLKVVEESFTNLRRALQVTEQNMLEKHKHYTTELRAITSDIKELKKEINEVKEKIMDVIKEMETAAKREEVKVLEKYVNLWNPVKFVTQSEVEQIVREMIEKHLKNRDESPDENKQKP